MISVVVPTFNERENVQKLFSKIAGIFAQLKKDYEVVVVDDHSTDGTWKKLESQKSKYPLKLFKKQGQKGKAFSLVEGFEKSRGDILVMCDADLQYPPEAIPQMLKVLEKTDVVVANRKNYHHSIIRKAASRTFRFLFGGALFGLNTDIQSGLKVMRRQVWETVKFTPKSQWTFDLEFLHRAKEAGFEMQNHDITFHPRKNGDSKLKLFKTTWEIGTNALYLRTKKIGPQLITPTKKGTMHGAGVGYKRKQFITHSTLPLEKSALVTFTLGQKLTALIALLVLVDVYLYLGFLNTAIGLVGVLTAIYFADVIFNAYLITKSLKSPPEISFTEDELSTVNDEHLPTYTILCPLYKEADILPQFIASIQSLDWPKEKLEVLLLLEEDDTVTQKVADNLFLPSYFKKVIVPQSDPKTKPKATNYGLHLATGKYLVIFDAEDRPDPMQLKCAYLAFKKFGSKITCFQAKLSYYNKNHNLLTRFFTAEYSLWFGLILTGLQSLNTAIPLGGTSNHFKREDLRDLQGWDPFNVTEDCDLGVRLFKDGYKTAIIDSTTLEEANSQVGNWLRQRSRWIKGYIQTFLVHNRDFPSFLAKHKKHALLFQLIVGGKIAFIMINPLMWATTIAYFVARPIVGASIEQFFPMPIFYMAVLCLVAGNFLYLYYYMIAAVKHDQFSLVKYILFIPIYWALISTAFCIAAYQLIFKPHFWEKTVHGFHLALEEKEREREEARLQAAAIRTARVQKIRELITSGTASGGILISAAIIGNALNFLYNAYLTRKVSIEDFGLISLVGNFLFLAAIPFSALSRTVTHKTAFYLGKHNIAIKDFWRITRRHSILAGIFVSTLWILSIPILMNFFQAQSFVPFILFTPVWLIGTAAAVDGGFLGGNLMFTTLALIMVSEAIAKLLLTWVLVSFGYPHLVYAAIPASMTISFLIGWYFASSIKQEGRTPLKKSLITQFQTKFFVSSMFIKVSTVSFISFDLILAKHFLPPQAAGQYAVLSLVGKMIFFIGGLFSQFILPIVSREEGANRNSKKIFYKLLFATALVSFIAYLGVGLFGYISVPILLGNKVLPIVYLLPLYGFAMFCFTTAESIVSFYQIRNKYLFPTISVFLATNQILAILLFHQNIYQIVTVMIAVGIGSLLITLFLHLFYEPVKTISRNFVDAINLFSQIPSKPVNKKYLRILIFNWRDTRHVWAGGAEVYIHEIAKRLVEQKHQVTIFCGNDGKSPRNEIIDGVQIIRRGGFYTVYIWAFLYYMLRFSGDYDVIIDSENGIPFFTPLYVGKPVIGLVHHIHQEIFRKHLAFPFAQFARFLEAKLMPLVYRNKKMITVSKSSKEAMERLGFGKKKNIEVINPGTDPDIFKPAPKNKGPAVLYLGRLKPYKSIDTLIRAMARVIKNVPSATLTIAGDGESRKDLEQLVEKLRLQKAVKFLGKVTDETKIKLFAKSWVMVQPSSIEGWGITAVEANASGTPVIASDVPGLRDSVNNPHSGFLVPWGETKKFAEQITLVLKDKKLRTILGKDSVEWSKQFHWEKSTEKFISLIKNNNE